MPIKYKIDILEALKDKGYTSYKLRRNKIIGERQIQQIRDGEVVSIACLSKICELLDCQPGDFLEYVPDSDETLSAEGKNEHDKQEKII